MHIQLFFKWIFPAIPKIKRKYTQLIVRKSSY